VLEVKSPKIFDPISSNGTQSPIEVEDQKSKTQIMIRKQNTMKETSTKAFTSALNSQTLINEHPERSFMRISLLI